MHKRSDEDAIKRQKYSKATVRDNISHWSNHSKYKMKREGIQGA
jgi:hypothetical protein